MRADTVRYILKPALCFIVFLQGIACCAQEIDAVQTGQDTAFIHQLQARAYSQANADSAIWWYRQALSKSMGTNYANGVARAYMGIGLQFIDRGDYIQGIYSFNEAYPWAVKSGDKETITSCYINKGLAYFYLGEYVLATENYYAALNESKLIQPPLPRMVIKIYGNLGIVSQRMGQKKQAIAYIRMAEEAARKENLTYLVAKTLINLGGTYGADQLDSAQAIYYRALALAEKYHYRDVEGFAYQNIGETYIESQEYKIAIPYLKKAIALSKDKYVYIFVEASYCLGDALYHLGQYKEAEKVLANVIKLVKETNLKDDKVKPYETLAQVYKATGQYRKAVDCLETIAHLKDSFTNTEKTMAFNQLELRYKTIEKDKLLAEKELLIARQKVRMTKMNVWITIIAGGVLILIIFIATRYLNNRHKHRAQIRSLEQESKIGVLKAAVQGADKERSRIAAELHDGIGGMLSAAMMRFMAIHHDNKEVANVPAYHEAMNLLDEMGDEIRKTAHNLMPEVLLKQSLPEAVLSFCSYMQREGSLQIDFQCYGELEDLSQNFKLSVYRIIQELLKNINQHARASHALVQLLMQEQVLIITVEDNGIGFDVGTTKTGIGLHNLQTRVSSLDGNFTLESKLGKGTSVNIEFDLRHDTSNKTT